MELYIYQTSKYLWRERDNLTFNPYEYDHEDRLVASHSEVWEKIFGLSEHAVGQ